MEILSHSRYYDTGYITITCSCGCKFKIHPLTDTYGILGSVDNTYLLTDKDSIAHRLGYDRYVYCPECRQEFFVNSRSRECISEYDHEIGIEKDRSDKNLEDGNSIEILNRHIRRMRRK